MRLLKGITLRKPVTSTSTSRDGRLQDLLTTLRSIVHEYKSPSFKGGGAGPSAIVGSALVEKWIASNTLSTPDIIDPHPNDLPHPDL